MHLIPLAYEGHPITIRDDGWFNATQAAAKWGKAPAEWLRLPATISYIEAFKRKYGNIPYSETRRGSGGGTWLHPKLAVSFARWIDDDFAVWCDDKIDEIIRAAADGNGAEYLPTYHALHQRVETLAANSSNKKFVHVNLNKLINSTVGIQSGERHGLPLPRKSLLIVAQAAATQAMEAANDHHDGYQLAKAAMGTIRPVAQQLAGQTILNLR